MTFAHGAQPKLIVTADVTGKRTTSRRSLGGCQIIRTGLFPHSSDKAVTVSCGLGHTCRRSSSRRSSSGAATLNIVGSAMNPNYCLLACLRRPPTRRARRSPQISHPLSYNARIYQRPGHDPQLDSVRRTPVHGEQHRAVAPFSRRDHKATRACWLLVTKSLQRTAAASMRPSIATGLVTSVPQVPLCRICCAENCCCIKICRP